MNNSNGSTSVSVGGSMSLSTILGIVFLILKLCNVIDWPWVCVCIPFIIDGCLLVLALILIVVATIIEIKEG
jgi:hypothetical protein